MKRIILLIPLAIVLSAFFAPQPCHTKEPQRNQDLQVQLEKLSKAGDLQDIINLCAREITDENYNVCESEITDENYTYSTYAAMHRAIYSFPRERIIPALVEGMKSTNWFISRYCVTRLLDFDVKSAGKYFVEKYIPPELSREEKKRIREIARDLGHEEYSRRKAAEDKLIAMGPKVRQVLQDLTRDNDMQVAYSARKIIDETRPYMTVDDAGLLCRLLKQGVDEARIILREALKGKYGKGVVDDAIYALGCTDKSEDADLIRPFLQTGYARPATFALANLKDKKSVPALIRLLEHVNYEMDAVRALRIIGDRLAIEPLEKGLMRQQDIARRARYMGALAELGKPEYRNKIIRKAPEEDLAKYCGYFWWVHDTQVVEPLLERLPKIAGRSLAVSMIRHLGNVAPRGDKKTINAILKARKSLESNRQLDLDDAMTISEALFNLGHHGEEKAIIACTNDNDPETRHHALAILAKTEHKRYLPLLLKACDDRGNYTIVFTNFPDQTIEVREAAIKGIIEISGEPFYLWDFDPDRQVQEIKAWWEKYQEQKAAEEKAKESNSSDVKNNEK